MRSFAGVITGKNEPKNQFEMRLVHSDSSIYEDNKISIESAGDGFVASECFPIIPYVAVFSDHDRGVIKEPMGRPEIGLPDLRIGDVVYVEEGRGFPLSDNSHALLFGQKEVNILDNVASNNKNNQVFDFVRAGDAIKQHYQERKIAKKDGFFVPNIEMALSGPYDVVFQSLAESKKNERNMALILAVKDTDYDGVILSVLDHRGVFFHWETGCKTIEDNFERSIKEAGLYFFNHGKTWNHKDYETGIIEDYGIDGEISSINIAKAAAYFGWKKDKLVSKMLEVLTMDMELSEEDAVSFMRDIIMLDHSSPVPSTDLLKP